MRISIVLLLVACQQAESKPDVAPQKPGGIRGTLASHTSGGSVDGDARRRRDEELHGARLSPMTGCEVTVVGGGKTIKTKTDDAGKYQQALPPGDYTLAFSCNADCHGGTGEVNPKPPATVTIKPGAWQAVSWTCELYAK